MRIVLAAAAAIVALSCAGVATAKDMNSCNADWKTAKASGTTQKHNDFISACLKGGATVAQTVTTKPAGAPAVTKTVAAPIATSSGAPTNATTKCKDGSFSTSAHHSGSCSHHGGVAQFLK